MRLKKPYKQQLCELNPAWASSVLSLSAALIFATSSMPAITLSPDDGNSKKGAAAVSQAIPESLPSLASLEDQMTSDATTPTVDPLSTQIPSKPVSQTIVDAEGMSHPLRLYSTLGFPNDPLANQWWVGKVRLAESWDVGLGSTETLLAIIDTGFALDHEELRDRWYTNPREQGISTTENPSIVNCSGRSLALDMSCNNIDDNLDGILDNESGFAIRENPSLLNCSSQAVPIDKSCNLIDDDANGLVDDFRGWDFASSYPSPQAGKSNPSGSATTHGTIVAGVASATGNNGVGIAGVNWETKVLPLQALDDDGYGDSVTVSRAIRYAADQGADVISLSLGTPSPDSFIRQAVAYAISKGSIVVAAAGNDGCQCMVYPARYEEVVAVGASDNTDKKASFSSYGPALDVLAPGVGMTSSSWTASRPTSAYATNASGTSFATPLVAGLLTSLRSHQPKATANQLIAALTEQVNRLTLPADTPRSDTLGFGRVDTMQTISRATAAYAPSLTYSFYPISGGNTAGSYEPAASFGVTQCAPGKLGTTTIYKLVRYQNVIYTVSQVERYKAILAGYTATANGSSFCMDLPTDTPLGLRNLSFAAEFENRTIVKY